MTDPWRTDVQYSCVWTARLRKHLGVEPERGIGCISTSHCCTQRWAIESRRRYSQWGCLTHAGLSRRRAHLMFRRYKSHAKLWHGNTVFQATCWAVWTYCMCNVCSLMRTYWYVKSEMHVSSILYHPWSLQQFFFIWNKIVTIQFEKTQQNQKPTHWLPRLAFHVTPWPSFCTKIPEEAIEPKMLLFSI